MFAGGHSQIIGTLYLLDNFSLRFLFAIYFKVSGLFEGVADDYRLIGGEA